MAPTGGPLAPVFGWLRRNSERWLLEAAQADMARRYLGVMPAPPRGLAETFWRRVYVPVYRAIPWPVRRRLIVAMPGSHRRTWQGLRGDPGSPVSPSGGAAVPPDATPPGNEARGRDQGGGGRTVG